MQETCHDAAWASPVMAINAATCWHALGEGYRASLAIAERLARADPSNVRWQRDLEISRAKVKIVLELQKNRKKFQRRPSRPHLDTDWATQPREFHFSQKTLVESSGLRTSRGLGAGR